MEGTSPGTGPEAGQGTVAVVVKGWPRLSETFIAQEILGLERRGLRQMIVSLRRPNDGAMHAMTRSIAAPVLYLPENLSDAPLRLARSIAWAPRLPGWWAALTAWEADLLRDPSSGRLRRFGQACVLARELPSDVTWLHSHFLHAPASVTRYAALLTGLPWSYSAHAKDIWTSADWDKRAKLADARWGVTCTAAGHAHLAALAPTPDRVELVYHGLDFARFPDPPAARAARDGASAGDPVILLSVGRAVAKKGLDLVLDALARLPEGLHWRWVHIGAGDLLDALKEQADRLGLSDRVEWLGAKAQDAVIAQYRRADLFVLPCRTAQDGDRDGLPNVLMEAQSQALPCLSTRAAAVPELIEDGTTGLLVEPDNVPALAAALDALIRDPARRAELGRAGAVRVRRDFGATSGIDQLFARFAAVTGTSPTEHNLGNPPARKLEAEPCCALHE